MKTRSFPTLLVALILAVLASLSPAATNVAITTAINNAGTNYTFWGPGGYDNTLFITNGGQLTNVAVGIIGTNIVGTNHGMLVSGPGSTWQSTGTLQIGDNSSGNFNWMTISNGGVVTSFGGLAIGGTASRSNRVVVTGYGSVWTNTGSTAATALRIGNNGSGNSLTISDSGTVVSAGATFGYANATSTGNWALVTGTGSLWNTSGGTFTLGKVAGSQRLIISNGGVVLSTISQSGGSTTTEVSGNNFILVTGGGSLWTNTSTLTIGLGIAASDRMEIRDGGRVTSTTGTIGSHASSSNSSVLVTDPHSLWFMGANNLLLGGGRENSLVISNQGTVQAAQTRLGSGVGASNNTIVVTGASSLLTNTGTLYIGHNGGGNTLTISSSGTVVSAGGILGHANVNSANNAVIVEGSGSTWNMNGGNLTLGNTSAGPGNRMTITNGGTVLSAGVSTIGIVASTYSNSVLVTGNGSSWGNDGTIAVGAASSSNNSLFVNSGGLVESLGLSADSSVGNWISNAGGVFQFATNTPTISPNGLGRIAINAGTISFRGITNADVMGSLGSNQVGKILFAGNNTFRLNNASNTFAASPQNYTFDYNSANPSNYAGLEMINGGTAWKSAWLNIGSNSGTMLVSNTTASVAGVTTNHGTITIANAGVTWLSNVVLSAGSYTARAGTNAFSAGVTIQGGTMTLDAFSTLSGAVVNNSLLQILSSAVYSLTNGQSPTGTGAITVANGGTISLTNGSWAGFGGNSVTNHGLLNVQSGGTLNFTGGALTPQGSGAARVDDGGFLNFASGVYTFGNTLTNNGLLNVQSGGTLNFTNGTVAPSGTGRAQVDGGGTLNFTNGTFAFGNTLTNAGTVNVVNSRVTYAAPVVISGGYISDPSTNTFTTNVTVTSSGYLVGGLVVSNADQFVFEKDLLMLSTNRSFNVSQAGFLFTNSANHLLSISNSGALNIGQGYASFSQVASNFAVGTLSIALSNKLTIAGNKDSLTNALYVGWLDIQGLGSILGTNNLLQVSNTLVTVLSLPNINLYYDVYDPRNNWLTAQLPPVAGAGYDLWSGGLLLPIPEPSPFLAVGTGLALLAFLRRRKAA